MKYLLLALFFLTACAPSPAPQPFPSPAVSTSPSPTSPPQPPTIAASPPSPSPAKQPSPQPIRIVSSLKLDGQRATLTSQDAGSKINVRDEPGVTAFARHYGLSGDPIELIEQAQNEKGETWYRVKFVKSGADGWVRDDFVATTNESAPESSPPPETSPVVGAPLRASISGMCECPYDTDKRGRSCGGRSAYSRPGGASPACYVGE